MTKGNRIQQDIDRYSPFIEGSFMFVNNDSCKLKPEFITMPSEDMVCFGIESDKFQPQIAYPC